ncbi:outer membrane protein assembly factor BamB family protein [Micromonosporaceae bacterium Da 78-11]
MLIDLDVRPPPSRTDKPRVPSALPAVAVLLLLTGLLGAAAAPGRRGALVEVASTHGRLVYNGLLTSDVLYTTQVGAGAGVELQSRPLHPGGPAWTVTVPTSEDQPVTVSLTRQGPVVVVAGATNGSAGVTVFLDAATGAEIWRTPEYSQTVVLDDRVATTDENGLRVVSLRTGKKIWSRRFDGVAALDRTAAGDRLVVFDFGGRASVLDTGDGRVLRAGRDLGVGELMQHDLDGSTGTAGEEGAGELVVGDQLYLYGATFLAAYRLPDLRRLWRLPTWTGRVAGCGPAVCAVTSDGMQVLDPATGALRRSGHGWQSVSDGGVAMTGNGTALQIDLSTGRDLRTLGHGTVAGELMLFWDEDGMWVTDLRHGRPIALVHDVVPVRCSAVDEFLTCPGAGRTMTVWRVDRR